MSDTQQPQPLSAAADDVTERIIQHLLHRPYDLLDSRCLLRTFNASTHEFLRALERLEERTPLTSP